MGVGLRALKIAALAVFVALFFRVGAWADPASQVVLWSNGDFSTDAQKLAQQKLWVSLFNTGRLDFVPVDMTEDDKEPGDVVRRIGSWYGGITKEAEAVLCLANPDHCQTEWIPVEPARAESALGHVGGYAVDAKTEFKWSISKDDELSVPLLTIAQTSRASTQTFGFDTTSVDAKVLESVDRTKACREFAQIKGELCLPDYRGFDEERPGQIRNLGRVGANTGNPVYYESVLSAPIAAPELPLDIYGDTIVGAEGYQFTDQNYDRIFESIGANVSAGIELEFQSQEKPVSDPTKELFGTEGLFEEQQASLEAFLHSPQKRFLPKEVFFSKSPMQVGIIDQPINYSHCEFFSIAILDHDSNSLTVEDGAHHGENCHGTEKIVDGVLAGSHGTTVFSVLAARKDERGTAGLLSPLEKVVYVSIPAKKEDLSKIEGQEFLRADLAIALQNIDIPVINMSLTYKLIRPWGKPPLKDVLKDVMEGSHGRKTLFVSAFDNDFIGEPNTCFDLPACSKELENVLSVRAFTRDGYGGFQPIYGDMFHSDGPRQFLGAPGEQVLTATENYSYTFVDGSSYAAPFVTAAAALILNSDRMSVKNVKDLLIYTSDFSVFPDGKTSGGMVDLVSAVLALEHDFVKLKNGCFSYGEITALFGTENTAEHRDLPAQTVEPDGNAGDLIYPTLGQLKRVIQFKAQDAPSVDRFVVFHNDAQGKLRRSDISEFRRFDTTVFAFTPKQDMIECPDGETTDVFFNNIPLTMVSDIKRKSNH
ncbi:S8 family serine peptidase [uncultured Roseobacter sp.]|uniref:S8 family serine peptidase n=1 Tax=uncultured Roseobacter sp. TaxID=114847 RepID=UPI0026040771|nr:S8 family serine peptidase [uncultured Roseobacter sp.]